MAFFDRLWTSTWHSLSLNAVELSGGVALIVCIHPSRPDLTDESQRAEAAERYRATVLADA